jgi:hypothetical protein
MTVSFSVNSVARVMPATYSGEETIVEPIIDEETEPPWYPRPNYNMWSLDS